MNFRLLFRHLMLLSFLVACDDLPEDDRATSMATVSNLVAEPDTTDARLSRLSPPEVFRDTVGTVALTVHYGAPSVRGRDIFGELVPFGVIWRTGANEATTLSVSDSVLFADQPLGPGRYALFTIPNEGKWQLMLNTDYDQWGAYNYDPSLDVLTATLQPRRTVEHTEKMTFLMQRDTLQLLWADLSLPIPVRSMP